VIFVDTNAWFARFSPRDSNHELACAFHRANREPLVTTDYVIDETLTLFKVRGNFQRAMRIGPRLLRGQLAELVWVEPGDVDAAWEVFQRYRDKAWSFTDCVSYVTMRRLAVRTAFAFDEHFRQFGSVEVLP
jgi:predicted nucleic acid-binding protein